MQWNGPVNCTQTIFVEHVSDWVVEFPADITAECVDGSLPDFGEPEVFFDECELIGLHSKMYTSTLYQMLATRSSVTGQ
jgi:hypothetical protein